MNFLDKLTKQFESEEEVKGVILIAIIRKEIIDGYDIRLFDKYLVLATKGITPEDIFDAWFHKKRTVVGLYDGTTIGIDFNDVTDWHTLPYESLDDLKEVAKEPLESKYIRMGFGDLVD